MVRGLVPPFFKFFDSIIYCLVINRIYSKEGRETTFFLLCLLDSTKTPTVSFRLESFREKRRTP